jgi:hypothetical protein
MAGVGGYGGCGGYGGLGALDPITEQALTAVAAAATSDQTVVQDRARAAALLDAGYGYIDIYDQYQPLLFALSIVGLAASGWAIYARPKKAEVITLYSMTGVVSAIMAYVTRPAALRPTPAPAVAATATSPAMAGVLTWLDNRVAARTAAQPGWEAATWTRVATDIGQAPLDPAVNTLLTANSH